MIPSTKRQRQLIGIACGQLKIEKSIKADMLLERFGVESTCEISSAQADLFLAELRKKGFRVKRRRPAAKPTPRQKGNMVKLASLAQHEKIGALARLIDWRVKDGLSRWLVKRYSIKRVKTAQEAYLAIEGLKKMFENQMKKNFGDRWMNRNWGDPDIARYIEEHLR